MSRGTGFSGNLSLRIETVVTGPFQENSFILYYSGQPEAVLIDPWDYAQLISTKLTSLNLYPVAILNTHAHLDHIGAVHDLKLKYKIPFYLHKKEKLILNTYEESCAMYGLPTKQAPKVDHWINEENQISMGVFTFQLLQTPGHTPGGICFFIEKNLFVGDTLFHGSVGRTDLPGGDWILLEKSLVKLMREVPSDTTLYSGHGPETTLGIELRENPFLIPLRVRLN